MKKISILFVSAILLSSCVSKKKYVMLEQEKGEVVSELTKTKVEKEELEAKFQAIQERVDNYNAKINSLSQDIDGLQKESDSKFTVSTNGTMTSKLTERQMRETLSKVDPNKVSQAKTLKDSMNLAIEYNLNRVIDTSTLNEDEDIAVNINETVVMISISDKMLFNTGSYRVSNKANDILQKLADVINSEPSIDVMVEGHTDSRTISTPTLKDNWDLSVLRATSVVRKLQNEYNVSPEKLIASGRSSYQPLTANDTKEGRSKNRRTRIILLPNIDKFFALMSSN
ncbi:OmpA family protein [Lacinutrix sp. MedPE-SW]|uniref:OmpA/MotB family protein n=1 Tax=Lacinutrix sp. MedPE-SW TaxID=1860087 RepID=UPI00091EF414|nr:OmpA family protein [Lacinutrix sp. MedPE-SW]OIQ23268.1 MAG: cell envelope biogenesis protein OmpA [Lacinutrix sp. MedPE-SW]